MPSDEEEAVIVYYYDRRYRHRIRRWWVHPYIESNINCRMFVAARDLQENDETFIYFYRTRKET